MKEQPLRTLLSQPADKAAPLLIGAILTSSVGGHTVSGIISEVEAYDQSDPASHTFRGRTKRNNSMFEEPGTVYVYFTYGMHYCMNLSVYEEGFGAGVLLRAVQPLTGIEHMWRRRYGTELPLAPEPYRMQHLVNGPAKLTQAFGVDRQHDGVSIFDPATPIRLDMPETPSQLTVVQTPRIGISQAKDMPWRWVIKE